MIRAAKTSDLEDLAIIFSELHEFHVKIREDIFNVVDNDCLLEFLHESINANENIIFIEEENSTILGYVFLKIYDDENEFKKFRKICKVEHLVVKKEYQKQGIGGKLLDYAKEYAIEQNCSTIELSVWSDNYNALDFYALNGFTSELVNLEFKL